MIQIKLNNTKNKLAVLACVPALLLAVTACSTGNDPGRTVIQEPGKTITVINDSGKTPAAGPSITLGEIEAHGKVEIFGWLNEETLIVAKENESLAKMKLAELADSYPRSLYLYNVKTREFEPLKEQENVFLGGASLSPDKKHLIYQEYSLGDPVYYVMNLETKKAFGLHGEPIGGAISAKWADDGTIIGASYGGGAYTANTSGEISVVDGLGEGALYIVDKMKDIVYYNTNSDDSLKALNLTTKETKEMGLGHLFDTIPSPDGNQIVLLQYDGSRQTIILCDADGSNRKKIADGTEVGGVSWSPDQRFISYTLNGTVDGATVKGLYVHDLLSGESTQIVVDVENASTVWSPTNTELAYTEWDGNIRSGGIVRINASLQP